MDEARAQLEAAIAGLEAQRAVLGSALVDAALAPLRERLAALQDAAAPEQAPAQVLRPVTVLFMDVVGFTALSRRLDPEDLHELIDGALARCTAVVEAHGGRVMQYAGDQLLAVFGERQAAEDDAERAVRSGLALLAEGRALGERARRLAGADAIADVRVGIHTGPALLGGGVDGDGAIRGLTVNVAARMEQTAPPGGLRISRDTWRQVRGLFDAEAQAPLEVKGLDAPLPTWIVRGELAAAAGTAQRGVEGLVTPLVGREAERAALHGAFEQVLATGRLQRLTLLADAGLGKSRLLASVQTDLATRGPVHRARALRHGLHQPYGVLRHWLSAQGGLADSDDADTARAKLGALFGAGLGAQGDEATALVGQLLGLDFAQHPQVRPLAHDARQLRQRAFHALAQWLQSRAREAPQVLLLDDMHWADEGSLDAIDHLAAACAGVPVLLAVFARPALRERRPAWCEAATVLAPLPAAVAGTLLDALLQHVAAPPLALRELLLQHADGNPFHLEELVAMCLDDGVIVAPADGPWRVDLARLSALRVPPTLAGVLQARLDALDAAERRTLQQASVVGHVHWDSTLRHLEEAAAQRIAALTRRELVVPHADSAFAGAQEFAFKHHLLHQATYDTVLRRERRDWHRRTAEWLVQASGGRIDEHLALVAEHWERAGEAQQAATWWQRAAARALAAAAFTAVLQHVERALALLPDGELALRFDLLDQRMAAHNALGLRDAQRQDVEGMLALAARSGDTRHGARAAATQAQLLLVTGEFRAAIAEAERAITLAETLGDTALQLSPLANKGQALIFLGELDAAGAALDAALPLARTAGRLDMVVVVLNRAAELCRLQGDFPGRRARMLEALAAAEAGGHLRLQGGMQSNLGGLALECGQLEQAQERLDAGLKTLRAIGDRGSEGYTLLALAMVQSERGALEQALATAQEALARATASQDAALAAAIEAQLGEVQVLLGQGEAARAHFARHDAEMQRRDGARPHAALVHLALAEGRLDEARTLATALLPAAEAAAAQPARPDEPLAMRLFWACHCVALAEGDVARAAALLARAHEQMLAAAAPLPEAERAVWTQSLREPRAVAEAWAAQQQV
ncbi:MAG: AAA family ATPase [Rubrivivax sp.]|nr:AAA family ATPase [Rubrivivax sp.]